MIILNLISLLKQQGTIVIPVSFVSVNDLLVVQKKVARFPTEKPLPLRMSSENSEAKKGANIGFSAKYVWVFCWVYLPPNVCSLPNPPQTTELWQFLCPRCSRIVHPVPKWPLSLPLIRTKVPETHLSTEIKGFQCSLSC